MSAVSAVVSAGVGGVGWCQRWNRVVSASAARGIRSAFAGSDSSA
ncbi:hypothetical protein ABZ805_06785 [Saccharopolyspora sp. NPDC047091]